MKKYYFTFIITLCIFLSSCGVSLPNYFGDKYAPTSQVEIFYSTHDVVKPYKVIGHLTYPNIGQDEVKAKFVNYAKTIGADAIVITGSTVDNGGKASSDIINADALKYTN